MKRKKFEERFEKVYHIDQESNLVLLRNHCQQKVVFFCICVIVVAVSTETIPFVFDRSDLLLVIVNVFRSKNTQT